MIGLNDNSHSRERALPAEIDIAGIDLTARIFAQNGFLHSALALQNRPQQAAMADAAAHAFAGDTPLLVEAGTGVGKSLAYLLPGLIHAVRNARQLVVSTHTIPLQEQIQSNDLKLCRQLFEKIPELKRFANFKTALLVGKANYLCSTRLAKAIEQHTELIDTDEQASLRHIREWAPTTQTGLREELGPGISPDVWDWVNADSSVCNTRNCNPATCPYQRARARIAEANIIIVNHSLLFSLIAAGASGKAGARGVLFPSDFVVLDEAHRIPACATDHFGSAVSAYALEKQLKMLWNPKRNRGFLSTYGKHYDQRLIAETIIESEFFFNEIERRYLDPQKIRRLREPNWIENRLNLPLQKIITRLGELFQTETAKQRKEEIDDFRRRLSAIHGAINDAVALADVPDSVYWVERTGVRGKNITLQSAPLDVSGILREKLFERKTSVVLTSATLSDGIDMKRFKAQTGSDEVDDLIELSPFDYKNNMAIFAAADGPVPDAKNSGVRESAWFLDVIDFCIQSVTGGTLVLCTSHRDVKNFAEHFTANLAGKRPVFAQLGGAGRSDLVARFKAAGNGVLIGTDSFWTGVDVPGPALSQVIVVRLPFATPSHPVVEARGEKLTREGKNPFAEMTLPDALIQFRQGIGRLIRKTDDKGRLVILDSRILTKTYGKQFVAALPHDRITRFTRANMADIL